MAVLHMDRRDDAGSDRRAGKVGYHAQRRFSKLSLQCYMKLKASLTMNAFSRHTSHRKRNTGMTLTTLLICIVKSWQQNASFLLLQL